LEGFDELESFVELEGFDELESFVELEGLGELRGPGLEARGLILWLRLMR
jgi:hypothetical protein